MENLSSSFGTSREGSEASSDNVQDRCLLDCLVHLQATLDHHRASIKLQDDILRVLFEGLCPSKGKKSIGNNPKPYLASLLIKKSVDWNGCLDGTPIPSNSSKLLQLYKEKGMVSPQEWKLCIGNDTLTHDPQLLHPSLEDVEEAEGLKCLCEDSVSLRMLKRDCQRCCERCPTCSKPRKEMIKFHYIPLIEQLKKLCLSESYCHDFLGMWRARSSWLGKEVVETPTYIHEFWDGEKTRLYQEFWDPDAYWEAPVLCCNEFCNMSYRAFPTALKSQELHSAWNECSKEYIFKCTKCRHPIKRKQQFVRGDPRNFALMLHWDGFQAASTTIKDSAVVEVVVLNGGKRSIIGSLPVLFLPLSHKDLEKKHSDILTSFLHPLICDLETSFSEGFDVDYSYPTNAIHTNIQGGLVRLRTMFMLCTGDHPAQCKLGQLKDGGKSFCRRDKAHVTLVEEAHGGRYVYDRNRYQGRYPPEKRKVQDMWDAIRASNRCATKERKEDVLRNAGLSGVSILWRLYHLYGFDNSRDLVYDVMHILSLLFQKYIKKLMFTASTSMKRKIDQIVKDVAKFIPKTILNSGRWPYNPSKHYKMFKAEECQKFVQWCLPQILNIKEGVSKPDLHLGLLLIDIAHFFFDCSRKKGWTQHDICVCRVLLLSWRILSEEHNGPNSSPLEHVAGCGEIFEDIMRHGSHDCYWCFSFERSISGYLGIPTNNKSNERGIIVIYNIHLVAMIGTKEESFMLHQRSKLEKLQLDVIDYFHVAVLISFIRKVGSVRAENIQPIGFQYAKVFFKEDRQQFRICTGSGFDLATGSGFLVLVHTGGTGSGFDLATGSGFLVLVRDNCNCYNWLVSGSRLVLDWSLVSSSGFGLGLVQQFRLSQELSLYFGSE
ncbi:hypothetical protein L7F22_049361 [Adiantum nelumboides]|nr:hypothetical protein [Adiantum nelumboides]